MNFEIQNFNEDNNCYNIIAVLKSKFGNIIGYDIKNNNNNNIMKNMTID